MHIHFICTGNVYRSRLAEAYFKSVTQNTSFTASSSGIIAATNKYNDGPICWYAMRLLKLNKLVPFMSWSEQQTTTELVGKVDLIIGMSQTHVNYCRNDLGYIHKPFEVWNIEDLGQTEQDLISLTEQTYSKITSKVDDLVARLTIK
jgi:protein-tyrosine-phosphatase